MPEHLTDHPTDLLPLHAASLLDAEQTAAVSTHVRACPVCAEELRGWGDIAAAARAPATGTDPGTGTGEGAGALEHSSSEHPLPEGEGHGTFAPLIHLNAEKADRYRAILQVFAAERERFLIHLRPEDIVRALRLGTDPHEELAKLVEWGNLRDLADTDRVTTVEDFHRRRRLYAMTTAGEAAERAIASYTTALGRRAELQTVALVDISAGLDAMLLLTSGLADHPIDAGRAAAVLRDLTGVFEALADNAAAFMSGLARTIDAAADRQTFLAYKNRLLEYLQRFLTDLVGRSATIAEQLTQIGDLTAVARTVAAREAHDASPDASGQVLQDEVTRRADAWLTRWEGLRRWFLGTEQASAQADLLRRRALTSIRELLAAATAINERRSGRSDRAADYRALARWFADTPDEEDCHRLWRMAFGLSSSRHLTIDADTIALRRDDPVSATTSWTDAPAIMISPRLRATGRYERKGRLRSVTDRGDAQAQLRRIVAGERADLASLHALPHGQRLRLSELTLDQQAFDVLLDLLGDALAATSPNGGVVQTESRDGSLHIRLEPAPDGATARLSTGQGDLWGPDHVLTLTPVRTTRVGTRHE